MTRLEGKTALVTGGGAGIGAAIAERFVSEGARVCIADWDEERLERTKGLLPEGRVVACLGDVSSEEAATRMVQTTVAFGGRLDVLVNNAGMNAQGPIHEVDRATFRKVLDVNLTAPFVLMKAAIPYIIEGGGGSIINISSLGGMRSLPGRPAYCTSKAGLIMLTQQAAQDYGPHKIRCNAVCPGGIKTTMTEEGFGQVGKILGMDYDNFYAMISSELPLHRFAEADEIAGICTYLASDDSSFMTGAVLAIDGGTAVVDVVGASIMGALKRKGIIQ